MAKRTGKSRTANANSIATATVGSPDPVRTRIARKALQTSKMDRTAGMYIDVAQQSTYTQTGQSLDTYRSSYANGLGTQTGAYDIPRYFIQLNQQNGGVLAWPITRQERYSWYRYWSNTDAYIGRGLDLLSDLPMSKLTLTMPKSTQELPKEKRDEIRRFFINQMDVLNGFQLCQSILYELNMIGGCTIFHEWDDKKKMWASAVILPPEEVGYFEYPFSGEKRIEYRPERLIAMIKQLASEGLFTEEIPVKADRSDMPYKIVQGIPQELVKSVLEEDCIVMDADPSQGSFAHYIARRKSPYMDLSVSILERVLIPMLTKEIYRYTQLSLASRNMTPTNLVTAPGLLPDELADLRMQIDLRNMDPDYTIITNYEVNWEQIGSQDRLLNLDQEYERIEAQVFAALGVTRELLTGEGQFSGSKVTVDILNTMFLIVRESLKDYIEKKLFLPICVAHDWFTEDANGIRDYWYPRIGFNRLTIRDNAEVFDSLFQLYAKGSIPVDTLYELFNLNSDEMEDRLLADVFTAKDTNFNRIIEEASTDAGRAMGERTDIAKRIAKYLKLEYKEPEAAGGEGGMEGFSGAEAESPFGDDSAETGDSAMPSVGEDSNVDKSGIDRMVDAVSENVPATATDDEIRDIVDIADGVKNASREGTNRGNRVASRVTAKRG
jgi:hypothetical protein